MSVPPYPPAAEAVDQALSKSIDTLRESTNASISNLQSVMQEGFSRVERRIDDMVTRGEFAATVQRLDAKDEHLDAKVDSGFNEMKLEMAEGFNAVRVADRERNVRNRWFWGVLVALAGVVSGVVFGILSLVIV